MMDSAHLRAALDDVQVATATLLRCQKILEVLSATDRTPVEQSSAATDLLEHARTAMRYASALEIHAQHLRNAHLLD